MAALRNKENIVQWFEDQDFRDYVSEQYVETGRGGLVISARVIDDALTQDMLRSVQFSTVAIHYCQTRCGGDRECVLRCPAREL